MSLHDNHNLRLHRLFTTTCLLASAISAFAPNLPAIAASTNTHGVSSTVCGQMPDGSPIVAYTLTNANGLQAEVITYGATLTSMLVPDRNGQLANVNLRLDTCEDYLRGHPCFGSTIGRYANRIRNASFELNGQTVNVTANAGKHHIHGGHLGFHKKNWQAKPISGDSVVGVEFSLLSPHGDEGFPGNLQATATYQLYDSNKLVMSYTATTDRTTVVNLTNHAYWNLAGTGSGDVLEHVLQLNAEQYLPSDESKIPTGEKRNVAGTAMDFRTPHAIGARIKQVIGENYDHCYVLHPKPDGQPTLCARVHDPASGRVMEVLTTQPGVQLYTARGLGPKLSWRGRPYGPYHGFCLETQNFPDAPNQIGFPSAVLRPGEQYKHVTIHRFATDRDR